MKYLHEKQIIKNNRKYCPDNTNDDIITKLHTLNPFHKYPQRDDDTNWHDHPTQKRWGDNKKEDNAKDITNQPQSNTPTKRIFKE